MRILFALLLLVSSSTSVKAIEPIPELAALAPFIGTWKTTSGSIGSDDAFEDISKWEWAYGGKILKLTHSVNQGSYYGESLMNWDAQQQKIIYRYVNNAGFYADGVITPTEQGLDIHEYIRGALSGPTETLSGYSVDGDGNMQVWFKVKMAGEWGEEWGEVSNATYKRAPDGSVVFKDN